MSLSFYSPNRMRAAPHLCKPYRHIQQFYRTTTIQIFKYRYLFLKYASTTYTGNSSTLILGFLCKYFPFTQNGGISRRPPFPLLRLNSSDSIWRLQMQDIQRLPSVCFTSARYEMYAAPPVITYFPAFFRSALMWLLKKQNFQLGLCIISEMSQK